MRLRLAIIFLSAAVVLNAMACGDDTELMEVTVGPELEDCVGIAPMKCMVVDGGLFYDPIVGFDHEPGYEYRLRIERYDPWEGEPPADASEYAYRLIEVIEKVRLAP